MRYEFLKRKENKRYLSFSRRRSLTTRSRRSKIHLDKQKQVLWIKPPLLFGQPLRAEGINKFTSRVTASLYEGLFTLTGSIDVYTNRRKYLLYDFSIGCYPGQEDYYEELLRGDLREVIRELRAYCPAVELLDK